MHHHQTLAGPNSGRVFYPSSLSFSLSLALHISLTLHSPQCFCFLQTKQICWTAEIHFHSQHSCNLAPMKMKAGVMDGAPVKQDYVIGNLLQPPCPQKASAGQERWNGRRAVKGLTRSVCVCVFLAEGLAFFTSDSLFISTHSITAGQLPYSYSNPVRREEKGRSARAQFSGGNIQYILCTYLGSVIFCFGIINQQGCIEFIKSDSKSIILIRIIPFSDKFLAFYAFIIHYSIIYNIIIHYSDRKLSGKERGGRIGKGARVWDIGTWNLEAQQCYMVLFCPQGYQCQPDFLPLLLLLPQ